MKEIEYKVHLSDRDFFAVSASDNKIVVGRILSRGHDGDSANLRHFLVEPEYRKVYKIGTHLHNLMVVWAKDNNLSSITTELVPKDPKDYEITVGVLEKLGYVCTLQAKNGYKFGFTLTF